MTITKIKAFGITRDILGSREIDFPLDGTTVGALRQQLTVNYPKLKGLKALMIAVNHVYAEDTLEIRETDEIALIPPVSGG